MWGALASEATRCALMLMSAWPYGVHNVQTDATLCVLMCLPAGCLCKGSVLAGQMLASSKQLKVTSHSTQSDSCDRVELEAVMVWLWVQVQLESRAE